MSRFKIFTSNNDTASYWRQCIKDVIAMSGCIGIMLIIWWLRGSNMLSPPFICLYAFCITVGILLLIFGVSIERDLRNNLRSAECSDKDRMTNHDNS